MTEYELLDAAGTYFGLGSSTLMGYFSVLTAYFISAYVVGSNLSRQQVIAITGLYLTMQIFMTWGAVGYFAGARALVDLSELAGQRPPIKPHIFILPLLVLGIFSGLKFMWDVRHPKT
jgi:hypothetical protein